MASFGELGLREALTRALEDDGIEAPTALQRAVIPVLRREGNVFARAASGSGKTLAYAVGVLDRLAPRAPAAEPAEGEEAAEPEAGGTRLLVLVPTREAAQRAALSLVHYAQAVELTVSAAGGGWGTPLGEADVLVATPAEVMDAVRQSTVKLDALEALVVDGASHVETLGGWEAVETLFDHVPRDAQRVLFTATTTPAVEDLADRRVKRALRWPPEAAVPAQESPATGVVGYVPVAEREKIDVVSRILGGDRGEDAAPVVFCRTDERAAAVAEELALRGFLIGDLDEEDVDVAVVGATATPAAIAEATGERPGLVVSLDVPADEETLRARHGGGEPGFVLVENRELAHLRDIARRAGLEARPAGVTGQEEVPLTEVRTFRTMLRRAVRDEDLGAQMLLLEPLFDDFTAAEVAAAASALLRRKGPPAAEVPSVAVQAQPAARAAAGASPRAAPQSRSDVGPAPAPVTRLFVGVGERDGVRAGDLVGAIAGETNIQGSRIGRIEIRDTFSIVEVPADVAEEVIRAVNGTTIKGRAVRVDFDRGGTRRPAGPARGPGARGPGGPRGDRPGGGGGRTLVRKPRPRE
jgi:ATP-dependent RNA helicase DeaD